MVLAPLAWTVYASFVRSDLDLSTFPTSSATYWLGHYRDILTASHMGR